jgi:hypothetical protein
VRRLTLALTTWVALACPGWAQEPMVPPAPPDVAPSAPPVVVAAEPRAVVTGPATAQVNQIVFLDASASRGDSVIFLAPESAQGHFTIVNGGTNLIFSPTEPGRYRFLVMAVGVVGGKAKLAGAAIVVTVGDGVPVGPAVPPAGGDPSISAYLKGLAVAFEATAAAVDTKQLNDRDAVLNAFNAARKAGGSALGTRWDAALDAACDPQTGAITDAGRAGLVAFLKACGVAVRGAIR